MIDWLIDWLIETFTFIISTFYVFIDLCPLYIHVSFVISNHLIQCTYKKCTICNGMWINSVHYRVKSLDLTMHLSNSVYDRCTLKSKIWKNTYELWALNQINSCILPEDVSDKTFLSDSLAFLYPTGTGNDTDTYWPGCMSIHIGIVYLSFASVFFWLSLSQHIQYKRHSWIQSWRNFTSWWWLLPQSLSLITQFSAVCSHSTPDGTNADPHYHYIIL